MGPSPGPEPLPASAQENAGLAGLVRRCFSSPFVGIGVRFSQAGKAGTLRRTCQVKRSRHSREAKLKIHSGKSAASCFVFYPFLFIKG